ncbi:MAG: hypothetical protein QOF52_2075 [Propionibacteriaceae bacterium]|jgi:uncharacterized protein YndB with AHSA1/START domain|nr:Activator of Hsp90 ATPase 1 family protein [Propionibacteriaceae bacterium]MDX6322217.1 hypothetical protein [Propionibacteriaceae bacterium]
MKLDGRAQAREVTRSVATTEHEGIPARVAVISQTYGAPIAQVWEACTTAERLPRWFLPVTGDLRLGGRYQFEGNAGGEILRCEEPDLIAVTWEYGGEVSWLTVRLREVDDGTELVLEHMAHVDDERWTEFGPGAVGVGWDMALLGLSAHLSGAAAVDPAEAQRWFASDEGIGFVMDSSDDWRRAAVADGDDPDAAAAAAARTAAAYTGGAPG